MSDPDAVTDGIADAEDAFDQVATLGRPTFEEGIDTDEAWTAQLTKGCQLIDAARTIREHNGHYTAVVELCFGAIERSVQAWLLTEAGDDPDDLNDHETPYERADEAGLFDGSGRKLGFLYSENRTRSYYANTTPTEQQSDAMFSLAQAVHDHVVDLVDHGYCSC